jgi:hypothetical protein
MPRSNTWTNSDGLIVGFGTHSVDGQRPAEVSEEGNIREIEIEFTYDNFPTAVASDGGLGYMPAGSYLLDAYLRVSETFTSETALNIGTEQSDGTDIDADGIDAALDAAALVAGAVIACDGADIGSVVDASNDAYFLVSASGNATAGKAKLVVRYIEP